MQRGSPMFDAPFIQIGHVYKPRTESPSPDLKCKADHPITAPAFGRCSHEQKTKAARTEPQDSRWVPRRAMGSVYRGYGKFSKGYWPCDHEIQRPAGAAGLQGQRLQFHGWRRVAHVHPVRWPQHYHQLLQSLQGPQLRNGDASILFLILP